MLDTKDGVRMFSLCVLSMCPSVSLSHALLRVVVSESLLLLLLLCLCVRA